MSENKKSGLQMRRQVMGDAFVDRALGNATEFTQPCRTSSTSMPGAVYGTVRACRSRPAA